MRIRRIRDISFALLVAGMVLSAGNAPRAGDYYFPDCNDIHYFGVGGVSAYECESYESALIASCEAYCGSLNYAAYWNAYGGYSIDCFCEWY
jgi:hypothetical protein